MIREVSVKNLGVVDHLSIELPGGMIALTGETGAGKTLLVDAISLLVGGRADLKMVRSGSQEAVVDGRFDLDDDEYVVSRVITVEDGRSKAYINGRPAAVGALADLGERLVDLHGQHAHQSLLGAKAQRESLDTFADIDLTKLNSIQEKLTDINNRLESMGGDERSRSRELDLIRYQVQELEQAEINDPDEEAQLSAAESILANAVGNKEKSSMAIEKITGDDGARDLLSNVLKSFENNPLFTDVTNRLNDLVAELDDVSDEVRFIDEQIEDDPAQLESIQSRRNQLNQLRKKYGDTLADVIEERETLIRRLKELEDFDVLALELDNRKKQTLEELHIEQANIKALRADAAPKLAAAIEAKLPALAMPKAKISITVDGIDGSDVSFLIAANPGSDLLPLAKVASGGELARTMLALRSVLSQAPPVLIFDEVDAGIGGQAGFSVGKALSELADKHQVIVVTHLPQVAAFADAHLLVEKKQEDDGTSSVIRMLTEEERVAEIARMLSGHPDSDTAKSHASELIASAQHARLD